MSHKFNVSQSTWSNQNNHATMPRGVRKERDHGEELCNRKVGCIYLCKRQDGTVCTFKARDIIRHYIRVHGSAYGAFACGVFNCTFRCPKGGACVTKHIAREHASDENAFYTFVPKINEFGPRDDDMPCSQYCVDEASWRC